MTRLTRLIPALAVLCALSSCKSITDALNPVATTPTSTKTTYPAIWITATWGGGRTGTPLESRSIVPTPIYGSYCPPNLLDLENHNATYYASGGDVGLTVLNRCTVSIYEVAICRAAGSGSSGPMPICATDPRQTSISNLDIQYASAYPVGRNAYGATSLDLAISVFYCATGSRLNLGQVPGKAPTDCVVQ